MKRRIRILKELVEATRPNLPRAVSYSAIWFLVQILSVVLTPGQRVDAAFLDPKISISAFLIPVMAYALWRADVKRKQDQGQG